MPEKPTITYRLGDNFYDKLDSFTKKVLAEGMELFGDEFKNIDQFYETALSDNSKRDDHNFRRTAKPFYLIESLYYQIFDDFNRPAFNAAKETVIILPNCLALMQDKCKRKKTRFGEKCDHCVPNCQINKIITIADRYGVEGYFSKRNLEKQLAKMKKRKPSLSVIGISCLLTLASGMRTAKELDIPSRGVFLNFTGCDHWSDRPFSTETAINRIESILKEKYELPDTPDRQLRV
jgi:uncharacterized protein